MKGATEQDAAFPDPEWAYYQTWEQINEMTLLIQEISVIFSQEKAEFADNSITLGIKDRLTRIAEAQKIARDKLPDIDF